MKFTPTPILGIVIGDTNSTCAMWEPVAGSVDMVTNSRGGRVTPTVAYYHTVVASQPPTVFVGEDAISRDMRQPGGLIKGMRAYVGANPTEIDLKNTKLKPDQTETKVMMRVRVGTADQDIPVDRVLTLLTDVFIERGKLLTGDQKISQAVVAVPPYYTMKQRATVLRCMSACGLTSSFTVSEPLAAVVGGSQHTKLDEYILVSDIGGGSILTSLVYIDSKGSLNCLSVNGDAHNGVSSIDEMILNEIDAEYEGKAGVKMTEKQRRRLLEKVEQIKKAGKGDIDVELPDSSSEGEFEYTLTSVKLKKFSETILQICQATTMACLSDSHVSKENITTVLLAGGGARLIGVRSAFQEIFPDSDVVLGGGVPPEEVISIGAATIGSFFTQDSSPELTSDMFHNLDLASPARSKNLVVVENEKTVHGIGVLTHGNESDLLLPPNTQLPASACHYFSCRSKTGVATLINLPSNSALGSLAFDVPGYPLPAGYNAPNLALKLSVAVDGAVEIVVIDLSGKDTMLRTGRLQESAVDPKQPVEKEREKERVVEKEKEQEKITEVPIPQATCDAYLESLNDRCQALEWFLESASLQVEYPTPEGKVTTIRAAIAASEAAMQHPAPNAVLIKQHLDALDEACGFAVSGVTTGQTHKLINVALGCWIFAVAPQDDDAALLKEGMKLGIPVEHSLGTSTLCHEIATYGAAACLEHVVAEIGASQVKQLLAIRNKQGLTPLEKAAVSQQSRLAEMMSKLVK
eukprot:TRINITY_DN15938_c0_g1_i1.p1 TRINITY_DN15938_c0_g1~~TRINITY_DN15938_c0_g1_i1.p1  ORF type:complete len:771 (+),score=159.35 TRINITY_DN15938_c0_g1_i1:72-2315(+)